MDVFAKHRGIPLKDRDETVRAMNELMGNTEPEADTVSTTTNDDTEKSHKPALSNVHGEGPLLLSDIPAACLAPRSNNNNDDEGVVLGIDEAGRGSVLGPMIYGAAFWHTSASSSIPQDFNDSKQLTEDKRAQLLQAMFQTPAIGFAVRVLPASEISRNMQRNAPYNLNQMSHDAAAQLIATAQKAGVRIRHAYIDTVGNADAYKRRLEREFPGVEFTVESKADANYAPCSAASVVAKNVRDQMMQHFQFSEPLSDAADRAFGSGYPSDPVCKKWMANNQNCKVFGFPDVVRFSWRPAKNALAESATAVTFAADEETDDGENQDYAIGKKRQQSKMSAFVSGAAKRKRYSYFQRKGLEVVNQLI